MGRPGIAKAGRGGKWDICRKGCMNRMRYLNVLQKLAKPAAKPRPDGILRTVTAERRRCTKAKNRRNLYRGAEAAPMFDSWGFRQMGGRRVAGGMEEGVHVCCVILQGGRAQRLNLRTGQRSPIHAVLTVFRGPESLFCGPATRGEQ